MDYSLRYAPAIAKEAAPARAARGITRNNVTVTLTGATITAPATIGGFIAATYTTASSGLNTAFTVKLGQNYEILDPMVLCVSWMLIGGTERLRYKLTPVDGMVPYEAYSGQVIQGLTARFELWTPGNVAITNLTNEDFVVELGTFTVNTSTNTNFTITPCVTAVTPTAGFGAYMTSCA